MCHTESKHLEYACQDSRLTQRQATYLSSPCGRWSVACRCRVAGERAETMRCRCERDTWPTDGMEPFKRGTTLQCLAWYLRTVDEFLMFNCRIENTDVKMWKHDQFSFRPLQMICIQGYRFSEMHLLERELIWIDTIHADYSRCPKQKISSILWIVDVWRGARRKGGCSEDATGPPDQTNW